MCDVPELASAVLGWRALADVSLVLGSQALEIGVLSALAQLPALRSMSVRSKGYFENYPLLPQDSFPSLRHLVFSGWSLSVVDAILCSWTVRTIKTLSITISVPSWTEITDTMRCIQEHCEPLTLVELLLRFRMPCSNS